MFGQAATITAEEIEAFWKAAGDEAASEPLASVCETDPANVPFQLFDVTYTSIGGRRIVARLAKPFDVGNPKQKYPVIISTPGYSGVAFGESLSDCQRGYIILQIYPRMQGLSGNSAELDSVLGTNWLLYGAESPAKYYYRGAFTDLSRGVDYLLTRPDVDADRIGAMGSSQGGFLSLGLAAIDQRIKAVSAHVPFLCNLRHNPCFDPSGGPNTYWEGWHAAPDARLYQTFDYVDPVNLAHRIQAPVALSSGGTDQICPAETIRAVYDRLPGIKSLTHYPKLSHASSVEFFTASWQWLQTYLKDR
jgi:cephalosporin-C deacetylase